MHENMLHIYQPQKDVDAIGGSHRWFFNNLAVCMGALVAYKEQEEMEWQQTFDSPTNVRNSRETYSVSNH